MKKKFLKLSMFFLICSMLLPGFTLANDTNDSSEKNIDPIESVSRITELETDNPIDYNIQSDEELEENEINEILIPTENVTSDEQLVSESELDIIIDDEEIDLKTLYDEGVEKNIIDPNKYPFDSFEKNSEMYFKNLFNEYNSIPGIEKVSYKEWLILNNYGVMQDTKEPLYSVKIQARDTAANKRKFCATVKKGDILISSGNSVTGLIGHAAIMTTDNWVLEMPGGSISNWKNNNRQITKDKWFDKHAKDWNSVYRCKNSTIASKAANWADRNYYNPNGGTKKTINIDYGITPRFYSTNPSYCSKLVVHAFWYGSGNDPVLVNIPSNQIVIPTAIPGYFTSNYALKYMGKF